MERFGEKLRKLREQHAMTQDELGCKLGVSRVFVSKLERRVKKPSTTLLIKLSELFNVPVDQLMKDELDV